VRGRILAVAAGVALSAVGGGPAHAGADKLTIQTSPVLWPAYRAATPDYVVRCRAGAPVTFEASIPQGQSVSVDGGPPAQGSLEQDVSLEPGQAFTFTVTDGGGSTTHNVRCLPADLRLWRVQRRGTPVSRWIAFAPTQRLDKPYGAPYNVIADSWGVPVWWKLDRDVVPTNTTVWPDGTVVWGRQDGAESHAGWARVTLDGTRMSDLDTAGRHADHHDIQLLSNGNHLMIAYVPRPHVDLSRLGGSRDVTVFDGQVQELTPEGRLVWSWSTRGHLRLGETERWRVHRGDSRFRGERAVDLAHVNSVQYAGPNLLLSARNANAVYLVRRRDGRILWKLGGTHRSFSLKVKGDRYGRWPLDGQHDARMHADGTVSVHDNGAFRRGRRPRMVRYRINRRTKTAQLVQRIRDRKVGHSYCCGSARRLGKGHWLLDWGSRSLIEEVTGRGRSVLAITLRNHMFSYRAQPVPRGAVSREALRAGMNAMFPRP
jgi:hypothetical protein